MASRGCEQEQVRSQSNFEYDVMIDPLKKLPFVSVIAPSVDQKGYFEVAFLSVLNQDRPHVGCVAIDADFKDPIVLISPLVLGG
jgi:hypothetical protein